MQYVKNATRIRLNLDYCTRLRAIDYTCPVAEELFQWLADFIGEAKHFGTQEIAGEDWVIRRGAKEEPYINHFGDACGERGIYICFRHEYDAVKFKMSDLQALLPNPVGWWRYGTNDGDDDVDAAEAVYCLGMDDDEYDDDSLWQGDSAYYDEDYDDC